MAPLSTLPPALLARSLSPNELVLTPEDALEALDVLASLPGRVLGWEGWLEWPDGRRGHSAIHQGTVDLSGMAAAAAVIFARSTITAAAHQFEAQPDAPGTRLLICVDWAPA